MRIPLVVHIKRHSLEDGPGIRSVVFFKGCPLRCHFCQNPETQSVDAQLAQTPRLCVRCHSCVGACVNKAISNSAADIQVDRSRCTACGACALACPSGALRRVGRPYTVEELTGLLLRDRAYYDHSGGGVTLSGGEAALFPEFAGAVARALKVEGISVCLQTCGHFSFDVTATTLLPFVDRIYFDLKLADPTRHVDITGVDNAVIWENLARLAAIPGLHVVPRTPVIAGMTDDGENLDAIRARVASLGLPEPILLAGHDLGSGMRARLGMGEGGSP